MRECPVLAATRDSLCLRVNRDQSAAGKGANVGAAVLIEHEIPSCDRLAPVAQNLSKSVSPAGPICRISRTSVIRTTLSPMHLGVRMRVMNFGHHVSAASVAMPRHCLGELLHRWIIQLANHSAPKIVVVIEQPYLRGNAIRF